MTRSSKLRLGLFVQETGHHIAGWRHPHAHADAALDFDRYVDLAREAERGLFDLLFIQDSSAMRGANDLDALHRTARAVTWEPLTTLAALSQVTSRIGLIGTATTTYNEPYQVARQFASLDRISRGRSGWNLVTSNNEAEAANFSRETHLAHADRYARAEEFVDVVKGLWDSWADDSFVLDKAGGRYFDPGGLQFLAHRGEHFQVRGPLTVARPPQGHPLLVQAGSSPTGRAFGAAHADIIFTAQSSLADARAFVADLRERAFAAGRVHAPLVMPGIMPVVGRTDEEAREKFAQLQNLVDIDLALATLATTLGEFDLRAYPLDGPLPELPPANGPQSRRALLVDMAKRENLTIRELALRVTGARGHLVVVGTAVEIADVMEHWFDEHAADGFNVMPTHFPDGLRDFVDEVVPELQRRGRYGTQYAEGTLRERLGLSRPHRQARAQGERDE
ncbi:LLM class flavin-dependent oxidoreductase [Paraburkholderia tropica]|uniref:LLM class flavin-dependent oxidoreductase n=1 Tax=Paraburkholderia tropica TaxID=92647 RepID=UPI0007EDF9E2|nr:LLM class flavin-dependent oxidoreductase [Paraburkholderia tropica]OBR46264.1 nitrilotriacetate monooxygenase [Paraburkholderia tropica]